MLRGLVRVENTRSRKRLIEALNANKDSDGKRLVTKKSNVQLFGIGKRSSRGYTLMVNRVHLLDDFKEHFTELYAALPEGDANARLALVRRITRTVRAFPEDKASVQPLIATLRKEARTAEFDKLPALPAGLKEHLRFAKKHEDIELLSAAWGHEGLTDTDLNAIRQVLRDDLGARLYLGKWYAYDAFKRKMGFGEDADGEWVPAGRLELLAASAEERKRRTNLEVPPQVDVGLLDVAAKKGDVIAGMDKGRVIAAKRGFPISVIRVREKAGDRTLMWAQWIMEDRSKIYFLNGFAFKKEEGK